MNTDNSQIDQESMQASMNRGEMPLADVEEEEPNVSPEEQVLYDTAVTNALNYIHGKGSRESVLGAINSPQSPDKAIGDLAGEIAIKLKSTATQAGKNLPDYILLNAIGEIVEELLDFGEQAGVVPINSERDVADIFDRAMKYATKKFGESKLQENGGQSDKEYAQEMQQQMGGTVSGGVNQALSGQPPQQPQQAQQQAQQNGLLG